MKEFFKKKNVLILFISSILLTIASIVLFVIGLFIENLVLNNAAGITLSLSLAVTISFSITINIEKQLVSGGDNANIAQFQHSQVNGDFYNGSPNGPDAESSFKIEIKTKSKSLLDILNEIDGVLIWELDSLKYGSDKYISDIALKVNKLIKSGEEDYKRLKSMVGTLNEKALNDAISSFLNKYNEFQKYSLKEYDLQNNRYNLRTTPRKIVEQSNLKLEFAKREMN